MDALAAIIAAHGGGEPAGPVRDLGDPRAPGARVLDLHLHHAGPLPLQVGGHDHPPRPGGERGGAAGPLHAAQHRRPHHPDGAALRHPHRHRPAGLRQRAGGHARLRHQPLHSLSPDPAALGRACQRQRVRVGLHAAAGQSRPPGADPRDPRPDRGAAGGAAGVLRGVGRAGPLRLLHRAGLRRLGRRLHGASRSAGAETRFTSPSAAGCRSTRPASASSSTSRTPSPTRSTSIAPRTTS